MSYVWVQLYIEGEDKPSGQAFEVTRPSDTSKKWDIHDLKKAVKTRLKPTLDYAPIDEIFVYAANVDVNNLENATRLNPGASVPADTTDEAPLIVTAPPQQQGRGGSEEDMRQVIDFCRHELEKKKANNRTMSEASYSFARELLAGRSIDIKILEPNSESGKTPDPPLFSWPVETKQDKVEGAHAGASDAKEWFSEHFMQADDKYGLKVMTKGEKLPLIEGNGKRSTGKCDLCIGIREHMEITNAYEQSIGLIELKTTCVSLKPGEQVLQLASRSTMSPTMSPYGKGVALLATDCNDKWELCYFSDATTIVRQPYKHGRKCWEDFRALLDTAEEREKAMAPPPSLRFVHDDCDDEQDLEGFEIGGDAAKDRAIANEAMLNAFADQLAEIYGERPVVPEWATAAANCPNYYD